MSTLDWSLPRDNSLALYAYWAPAHDRVDDAVVDQRLQAVGGLHGILEDDRLEARATGGAIFAPFARRLRSGG